MNYTKRKLQQKIENIKGDEVREKNRLHVFAIGVMVSIFVATVLIVAFFSLGAFLEIISNTPSVDVVKDISPSENKRTVE